MGNKSAGPSPPVVQSVDRALAVLEILGRDGWTRVSDLATELGTHKSTAFRLLATLERRGMVEQDAATQRYRLGFTLVRLASVVRGALGLTEAARPVCEALSRETDETVHVAVLESGDVVHIAEYNLSSQLVSVNWLGRHTALHATSSGKVFLAHMPERLCDEVLAEDLERITERTITDPGRLREQLTEVREVGYAHTLGELEEGLNAVAAPVRGQDGGVVACISASGPSYRFADDDIDMLGRRTREAADEISRRIGFLGQPQNGDPG